MRAKFLILPVLATLLSTLYGRAQSSADSTVARKPEKKYRARAPKTQPFGAKAFDKSNQTTIRWLGFAGFFINSRGTTCMVDPV